MTYRAEKSGISAELKAKMAGKYDAALAGQCLEWIKVMLQKDGKDTTGLDTAGDAGSFQTTLKDGYFLCRLMNVIKPGSVPESKFAKRHGLPFKQMEMVGTFVEKLKSYGLPDHENFQTVDLYEAQNLHQVVISLQALGRKAKAQGLPGFGPKEADKNERHFTQEQLSAGQNVIGLQMGSNKGASQAGQNFGKTRMIVD